MRKVALMSVVGASFCVGCNGYNPITDSNGMSQPEIPPSVSIEPDNSIVAEMTEPEAGLALSAIEFGAHLYVAESQSFSGTELSAKARFYRVATPLELEPELRAINSLDQCEVGNERSQINAEALDFPIDHILAAAGNNPIQVSLIAAGQSIELDSDAGSYLSLTSIDQLSTDGEYGIEPGTDMTISVPQGLIVNVSGDVFPAFQWQWIKPPVLEPGLRDAVRSVATNPNLIWNAPIQSDSQQSRIQLYAGYINELTGEYKSFQCELSDDGEFTMPQEVQALFNSGFVANFVDVARYTRSVQTINNVSVVNVFVQKQ